MLLLLLKWLLISIIMDRVRFLVFVRSYGETEHLNGHAHVLLSHEVSAKDCFTEQISRVEGYYGLHWRIKHLLLTVRILDHELLETACSTATVW